MHYIHTQCVLHIHILSTLLNLNATELNFIQLTISNLVQCITSIYIHISTELKCSENIYIRTVGWRLWIVCFCVLCLFWLGVAVVGWTECQIKCNTFQWTAPYATKQSKTFKTAIMQFCNNETIQILLKIYEAERNPTHCWIPILRRCFARSPEMHLENAILPV